MSEDAQTTQLPPTALPEPYTLDAADVDAVTTTAASANATVEATATDATGDATDTAADAAVVVPTETPAQLQERLNALIKRRRNLEADIYQMKRQRTGFADPTADLGFKTAASSSISPPAARILTAANRLAGITLEQTPQDESLLAFRLDVRETASYKLVLQLHSCCTTVGEKYFKIVVRQEQVAILPDARDIVERHMDQCVVKASHLLSSLRKIVQEVYFKCHCVHVRQDCVEYLEGLATLEDESVPFHIDGVDASAKNKRVEFTLGHSLSRVGKLDVVLEWAEGVERPEAIITLPEDGVGEDASKVSTILNLVDAAKAAFRNYPIDQALLKVSEVMAKH